MKSRGVHRVIGEGWIGLAASLILGAITLPQTFAETGDASPATSGSSSALDQYQQGRQTLAQELQTLIAQGITTQQMQAWWQQNTAQIQAQQQLAQVLSSASALQPMPIAAQVALPPGTSGTLASFLTSQAALANAYARIHNQFAQSLPPGASVAQVEAMRQQELQTFQQQNAAALQLQQQQAPALASQYRPQPVQAPPPPQIPPNATPQLQAFLAARNALAQDWAQAWGQYRTADPATRDAALQQWQLRKAAQLQQLQQLAQALPTSAATIPSTTQQPEQNQ